MKKINHLLLVALLFSTMAANAQNFSIFERSKCYFFQQNSTIFGVKSDSLGILPTGDTVCRFFTMFWEDPFNTQNCLDLYGGTLFGKKAILANDSSLILITKTSDSVVLKPRTVVGDSWIAYRWPNQDLMIKATVSSQGQQNVLGIMDEVKSIVFTVQNSANQVVTSNLINGKVLSLSQNSGLLNTFDFYHFPNDSSLYSLVEVTPVADYRKKVIKRIYDFNVGDVFHTTYNKTYTIDANYQIVDGHEEKMMRKVVSKTTYTPDTAITYSFERCLVGCNYVNYIKDSINIYDTITVTYSYQNFTDSVLFQMPLQTFPVVNSWYDAKILKQSILNSIREYSCINRVDVMLSDTSCWSYICADPGPGVTTYLEGLGGPYYHQQGWFGVPSINHKLVYYQKGETTWGTPIASNCLSLINDVQAMKSLELMVNVYPNPAMNKIFVDLQNVDFGNATLEIYSLEGKLLLKQSVATNSVSEIDLQSLPSGMFMLKIRDKDHHVVRLMSKL